MLTETILGAAIAAAVIGIVLCIRAILPKSCPTPGVERLTVLRCTGDAAGLEAAVRAPRDPRAETVILDAGMTAEARRRAELLAARYGAEIVRDTKETLHTETTDGRD